MSSASVTNMMNQTQSLSRSSMGIEEENILMMIKKKNKGIVTILGSGCCDTYTTSSASSLRRTLSADMSPKNWLSQNNNKTISTSSSSSEGEYEKYEEMKEEFDADAEAERERLEIWSSIQRTKKEEQEKSSSSPFDTWGSIMNLKGNNEISKSLPLTPYVHPLVKRSKSSLSEKSLQICTESLGSETGSDSLLFSPAESEDNKDREQQQQEVMKVNESACEADQEDDWYNNYHAITTKKSSPPRSFPPPLPSLSLQANNKKDASVHMRPHRDNGRLVLEAVPLPSQNNFNAQRQDGRLVITFTDATAAATIDDEVAEENYDIDEGVGDLEEEFEGFEEEEDGGDYYYEGEYDDDEEEEEEEEEEKEEEDVEVGDVESVMIEKSTPNLLSSSVQRLTLMINKPIGLVNNNRNQNWSEKFNKKGVNLEEVGLMEMEPTSAVAQSIPQTVARLIPSSSASAVTSFNFNAYEYYWKTKPTTTEAESDENAIHNKKNNNYYSSSPPHHNNMNNYGSKVIVSTNEHHQQQQLLVLRGKNGDYLVHNLKSCKDSRRPFLFWEPYCIATS